jgi:hypothetical protein
MGKLTESKAVSEEAYIHVSEAYDPEHPLVLEAGGKLIEILNRTGDYYDAERFARVCYDGLTRAPLIPDSFEAAIAASNLANASCNLINKNGPESADVDEAVMLARKAVRIIKELKGPTAIETLNAFNTLVNVVHVKKDFTDETKSLFDDYLSDVIRYQGIDGVTTSFANYNLGRFHHGTVNTLSNNDEKRKHLRLAESYLKESSRLFIKHYCLKHHINNVNVASLLS